MAAIYWPISASEPTTGRELMTLVSDVVSSLMTREDGGGFGVAEGWIAAGAGCAVGLGVAGALEAAAAGDGEGLAA